MARRSRMTLVLWLMSWLAILPAFAEAAQPTITEDEAYEIGVEAYTYAYPLVLMETTRRVSTNIAKPDTQTMHAPMGQFIHAQRYPDASFKDVVRPNADTLYSLLWFDVGKEPLVFSLPDTAGRYYVFPIMDMWTDVFATLGSRTTGTGATEFVLVGPRWKGATPPGMQVIVSPTDMGWVINRIQTNGAADYDNVHKLQAGLKAVPLSARGKPYTPPPGKVDSAIDMKPPVEQVAKLEPGAFFALFAEVLKNNPPHAADYAMLLRMERLGLVAGQSFALDKAPEPVRRALVRAAPDAYKRMLERGRAARLQRDGWSIASGAYGVYGNEYLQRGFVAYRGLGALPPQEATYPAAVADGEGKPLTGASKYVLHFDKEQLPPAKAFWSLTMYGPDQFFVDNPINRYAIGDRDKLAFNPDGSLDLYIQRESPGKDKESNWLPAAADRFDMTLRLYLPQAQALDGRWAPPALKRLP